MNLPFLATRLSARARRVDERDVRAAVLVPILPTHEDGLALVLTRRAETLKTHRGEVAFPGGRVEPGDTDLVATALREAHEEVNIQPSQVHLIGLLDDLPTISGKTMVTPVVGLLTSTPAFEPQPEEVARIFSIPIDALRDGAGWRTEYHRHRGREWPIYFFDWDGETLWGLSAYITLQLLALSELGGPIELPAPYNR
ncbi:MAG: CoA pyrophosphatase [Myxococcota bacterium]|nr:CoA pyrophosphatase [Myxococcota bacterium]